MSTHIPAPFLMLPRNRSSSGTVRALCRCLVENCSGTDIRRHRFAASTMPLWLRFSLSLLRRSKAPGILAGVPTTCSFRACQGPMAFRSGAPLRSYPKLRLTRNRRGALPLLTQNRRDLDFRWNRFAASAMPLRLRLTLSLLHAGAATDAQRRLTHLYFWNAPRDLGDIEDISIRQQRKGGVPRYTHISSGSAPFNIPHTAAQRSRAAITAAAALQMKSLP